MSFFWRCTLTFRDTNRNLFGQNVIYMEDASETKTAAQLGAAIDTLWWGTSAGANEFRHFSSFHSVLQRVSVQKIEPEPIGGNIPLTTQLISGPVGTGTIFPTVGFILTLLDGLGGKRHRGRVYHCGTPSSFVLNGQPTSGAVTAFNALRDTWLNRFGPLPTTGWHWNIFHRDLQGPARFTRVVDVRLAPFLGHQRRRNYGSGF